MSIHAIGQSVFRINRLGSFLALVSVLAVPSALHAALENWVPGRLGLGVVRSVQQTQTNRIYVATQGGGVYESVRTNTSSPWQPLTPVNTGLGSLNVQGLQLNAAGTTMFANTDDGGVYKIAMSGGAISGSWSAINTGLTCVFTRNLARGAGGALYLSTNCGGTFKNFFTMNVTEDGFTQPTNTNLPGGLTPNQLAIHPNPATDQVVFMATTNGIYLTQDGGANWTAYSSTGISGPQGVFLFNILIGASPPAWPSAAKLFALVNGSGVYRATDATDAGATWVNINNDLTTISNPPFVGGMRFDGTNLGVGREGGGAQVSSNALTAVDPATITWIGRGGTGLLPAVRFVLSDSDGSGRQFAATLDGLFYRSIPQNPEWDQIDVSDILVRGSDALHSIALPRQRLLSMYVMTDGEVGYVPDLRGGNMRSERGRGFFAAPGEGRRTNLVAAPDSDAVYATTRNFGVFKKWYPESDWFQVNNGLPSPLVEKQPRIYMDPVNSNTLYVTFDQASPSETTGSFVYRTTDGGGSWTSIATAALTGNGLFARALAIDPTNTNIIYVMTLGGLVKTADGGSTWGQPSTAFNSFGSGVFEMVLDPTDPSVMYVGVSRSAVDGTPNTAQTGVWKCTSGGASCSQLTSTNNFRVGALAVTKASSVTTLWAGRRDGGGVQKSTDGGVTWQQGVGTAGAKIQALAALSIGSAQFMLTAGSRNGQYFRLTDQVMGINLDANADVLWRHSGTGQNFAWLMRGREILGDSAFLRTVADTTWDFVAKGDFDGNGFLDIVLRNSVTGQNYLWLLGEGSNFALDIIGEGFLPTVGDLNWKIVGTGDFNGDGKYDILWRNIVTGNNYLWQMNGLTISSGGFLNSVPDPNWVIAGVGDFNGDGKSDILWRNEVAGGLHYMWLMDGFTTSSSGALRTIPDTNWKIAGVGDFNGDGQSDVLLRHNTSGNNYVWFMNGFNVSSEGFLPTVLPAGTGGWNVAAVADFTTNYVSDILWRNNTSGDNYLWDMNGLLINSACGAMVCSNGYLPSVPDLNWKVK